jgi:probable F420-dependent oxidoreductase
MLFSYMTPITKNLEFTTGIIILPQRQTALFAKQTATLDVLSGGRTRLGLGLGWNEVEYIALNENFHNRGKRIDEQVTVLRELWTKPLVQFQGQWHNIPDAGLNPLPQQRPIPIWFGGHAVPVLKRVATMGNGWMPNYKRAEDVKHLLEALDRYLADVGRSRSDIGLEARIAYGSGKPQDWRQTFEEWKAIGVTHITINTMGSGLGTPADHMGALRKFAVEMEVGKI